VTTAIQPTRSPGREILNKVPLVTSLFWIIKILATTVGETGADFLIFRLGWGLALTSLVMAAVLGAVLAVQLGTRRYVAPIYWLAVVFLSIVGTLLTDNLSDNLHVSLYASTAVFAALLGLTFWLWHRAEGTLSIHAITNRRRELFYWAAILFTFALGTAAGDLVSEELRLGYVTAGLIFGGLIAAITVGYFAKAIGAVLAFWLAYILTRPLGASIGDWLTQSHRDGGLGLGTMPVSEVFLAIIVLLVAYLAWRRPDVARSVAA
jgi:uncharacterized membrane-anchored protein